MGATGGGIEVDCSAAGEVEVKVDAACLVLVWPVICLFGALERLWLPSSTALSSSKLGYQ